MGEKILHRRLVGKASENGIFADVLTLKTHASGDEVISRYTVQKDYNREIGGGNYLLLKASCAARDYPSLANEIYFTVVNWNLLHRSNLAMAELLTSVNLDGENAFKIPASWHASVIAENRLIVDHTIDGVNYGVINFCFYSGTVCHSAEDAFEKSTQRFRTMNIRSRWWQTSWNPFLMISMLRWNHYRPVQVNSTATKRKCAPFIRVIYSIVQACGATLNW